MSRNVLVTGGGGFVGQWVARSLLARNDQVFLAGPGPRPVHPSILTSDEWRNVQWLGVDVRSEEQIDAALGAARPDAILHLAGVSSVEACEAAPAEAFDVNALGAVRLVSRTQRQRAAGALEPTVVVVGSGTQYGAHAVSEMPLDETAPQQPNSVYAASKAAQEIAVLQMARASGLRVVCTRSFNHSGPGHGNGFLVPSLIGRIRGMAQGDEIRIGNETVRDYLHVTDVAAAYLALIDRVQPGETYNVCSGIGVSVRDIARTVMEILGRQGRVVSDPALRRPTDIPALVGSPVKLHSATGWRPNRTMADIINDLLAVT